MKSFASILVAGFAAMAQAVQLTNSNYNVEAGQPFVITWSGASGPVTLTLKNGPSTALKTVSTIASGQSGTSFSWTPSSSLPSEQYAIEISDSTGTPNYSEQFSLATDVTASTTAASSAATSLSVTSSAASTLITSSASVSSASSSAASSSITAANSTTTAASSTRSSAASTRASTHTSSSTVAPSTVPGSDSIRLGSPIALIGLTVAAMLYFQ